MYTDKMRLVRETFYRQSILFMSIFAGSVLISFITCMKKEIGLQVFILLFTSFNSISLLAVVCVILAVIYYLRYLYSMKVRAEFLFKGEKYPGEIIDTFAVKNWFGQGCARNYKMVIQYAGNKEFVTPAYDMDSEYIVTSNSCNVYVLNGKEYATDFNLTKKGKDGIIRPSGVNEEDFLYSKIDLAKFNRKDFMEGRVTIGLYMSDKYIMPIPKLVIFNDNVVKIVVIDIAIESSQKYKVFSTFENELQEYIKNISNEMSSEQILEFNALVRKKLEELLHTYYYFVKIKSIDIGEI